MSWLLYNRCAWAHKTCETVNKSSKSDICYIDSDTMDFSCYNWVCPAVICGAFA